MCVSQLWNIETVNVKKKWKDGEDTNSLSIISSSIVPVRCCNSSFPGYKS